MKTQVLRGTDYKRARWKNGLGWTDQIAISPENADLRRADFDWRISTARVEQSAPFSPFAEHDRILVIVDGDGVRLTHTFDESESPEVVNVPPREPYEFPGDVPTSCELAAGPIQDLSVFIRKGVVYADVQSTELQHGNPLVWHPEGKACFMFVIQGQVEADGHSISKGEALRINPQGSDAAEAVTLRSEEAQILLIQIA